MLTRVVSCEVRGRPLWPGRTCAYFGMVLAMTATWSPMSSREGTIALELRADVPASLETALRES